MSLLPHCNNTNGFASAPVAVNVYVAVPFVTVAVLDIKLVPSCKPIVTVVAVVLVLSSVSVTVITCPLLMASKSA